MAQRRRNDEFGKAGERILKQRGVYGGARPAAAVWLLTLCQEKAGTYSLGELSNRWEEVKRFSIDGGLGPDEPPLSNQGGVLLALPGRFADRFTASRPFPGPGERETLGMLQEDLKATIEAYVTQGWAHTGKDKFDFIVKKDSPGVSVVAELYPACLYQTLHLLGEIGHRIRKCRRCKRLFLAGRSDKAYCSGTCQAMKWKDEHPRKVKKKKPKQTMRKKKGGKHGTKR